MCLQDGAKQRVLTSQHSVHLEMLFPWIICVYQVKAIKVYQPDPSMLPVAPTQVYLASYTGLTAARLT